MRTKAPAALTPIPAGRRCECGQRATVQRATAFICDRCALCEQNATRRPRTEGIRDTRCDAYSDVLRACDRYLRAKGLISIFNAPL